MGIDCSREITKKERIRFSGSLLKTRFLFGDFFSFFILSVTTAQVACKTAIVFRVLLPLLSVYYRYYILLSLSLLLLSLLIFQLEKQQ